MPFSLALPWPQSSYCCFMEKLVELVITFLNYHRYTALHLDIILNGMVPLLSKRNICLTKLYVTLLLELFSGFPGRPLSLFWPIIIIQKKINFFVCLYTMLLLSLKVYSLRTYIFNSKFVWEPFTSVHLHITMFEPKSTQNKQKTAPKSWHLP